VAVYRITSTINTSQQGLRNFAEMSANTCTNGENGSYIAPRTGIDHYNEESMPPKSPDTPQEVREPQRDVNASNDGGTANSAIATPLHIQQGKIDDKKESEGQGRALLEMLRARNYKDALESLKHRPYCNITDKGGNSPLHIVLDAPFPGLIKEELVKELLAGGADPNLRNHQGSPPLHRLTHPYISLASLLLSAGANIESRNNKGETWLFPMSRWSTIEDLKKYLNLGSDLECRDFQGRTMLHDTINFHSRARQKIKLLIDFGIDPNAVDYSGNTLFHEAILSGHEDVETMEMLCKLGLDIDQKNHAGNTPVHLLCSIGEDERWPTHNNHEQLFVGWVLRRSKSIDAFNFDGIAPLHLASTVSQYCVQQLLKLGVSPAVPTFDGLTSLHLAARARQSNIVGMLISAIPVEDTVQLLSFINAKDNSGRTALHHACRSGRPETVALLLNAGADPKITDLREMTTLDACVEAEGEQELWRGYRRLVAHGKHGPWKTTCETNETGRLLSAAGTKLNDKSRPYVDPKDSNQGLSREQTEHTVDAFQDTPRLEEILDMLLAYALSSGDSIACLTGAIERSISKAEQEGHIYTLSCLKNLRIQSKLTIDANKTGPPDFDQSGSLQLSIKVANNTGDGVTTGTTYSAFSMLHNWVPESPDLDFFTEHGLANILEKSASLNTNFKVDGHLLHAACLRSLPNMDVVRVLVEKFHVDVNTQSQQEELNNEPEGEEEEPMPAGDTALHYLARGYNWWHVAQAIPYLVTEAGANIELCNEESLTPLDVALRSDNGTFQMEAVRTLIKLGAKLEQSYLPKVSDDPETFKLVISQGVPNPQNHLANAAGRSTKTLSLLNYILSTGTSPDWRLASVVDELSTEDEQYLARISHPPEFYGGASLYALHVAASNSYLPSSLTRVETIEIRIAKMSALLSYGANPHATYRQFIKRPKAQESIQFQFPGTDEVQNNIETSSITDIAFSDDEDDHEEDIENKLDNPEENHTAAVKEPHRVGLRSIIHAILEDGGFAQPILQLPFLDLEHREAQGRTLLLSACRSSLGADAAMNTMIDDINHTDGSFDNYNPFIDPDAITPLKYLLSRGANPLARDNWGKNALVQLFEAHDGVTGAGRRGPPIIRRSLQHLANNFPELVNQPDNAGTYPLHAALQRMRRYDRDNAYTTLAEVDTAVGELLAAGADPHARDGYGNTALHHLAIGLVDKFTDEHRRLFRLFLDRGVNVNLRNKDGWAAISIFLHGECPITKKYHAKIPDHVDNEVLEWFENAGTDWNVKDPQGRTLLHIVAGYNNSRTVERVKFLLGKGVDPMEEDKDNSTAWDVATTFGNDELLKLRVSEGKEAEPVYEVPCNQVRTE
jgi:ankyrin repeat protein